ncbi:MAG TPA: ferritin-like domain-containing protein [Alphaproteobacteria bacterium]|nr:ferritin-like domain-containing protein [Alphaproteobacteria bacterium]
MKSWTLTDIPWCRFDPAKVDPQMVTVVKAAAMVEHNGGDYATYLCNVFHDDPQFQAAAREWAQEEIRHGQALARWAKLADPAFDFESQFERFTNGFRLPLRATRSVRGSRTGELIARCIVETGTSSFYSALAEACEEPVLKAICRNIAADEFRHYKLFYDHMKRYQACERPGLLTRARVIFGRLGEVRGDDELPLAYYCANPEEFARYDRRSSGRAYSRRASQYYRPHHVERAVAMILKALGIRPNGRLGLTLVSLARYWLSREAGRARRSPGPVHGPLEASKG